MTERGVFLTAEWRNLLMLNYAVAPSLLLPHVPAGTELDSYDGQTYISLVAFEFNKARVGGVSIPFHRSFEEVNLRFYVRRGERRGVVFIRELVPRFAVAAIARIFFGENYSSLPMTHAIQCEQGEVRGEFNWGEGADACSVSVTTRGPGYIPPDDSLGQFITEHYWGYATQRDGSCVEYEVQHPRWLVRDTEMAKLTGDASSYYGSEFAAILRGIPDSAFLAEGSSVIVFKGARVDSSTAGITGTTRRGE